MGSLLTTEQAAKRLGIDPSRVRQLAIQGRIEGAQKFGKVWTFPEELRVTPGKSGPSGVAGSRA